MKNCTQCNCQNDDSALFCRQCGAKLPEQVSYTAPVTPHTTAQPAQNNFMPQSQPQFYTAPVQPVVNQPKKKGKGCLIGALVAVGVVVLFIILVVFTSLNPSTTENETQQPVTVNTMVGDYSVMIKDSEVVESNDGNILIVTYLFQNHSDSSASFAYSISDKAFQNGIEAEKEYFVLDHDFDFNSATKDIQNNVTLEVQQAYRLNDPTSPVTIEITRAFSVFSDEKLTYTIDIDK